MNKLALTQEIDSVRSVVINGLKHYVATDFCRTIGIINSSSVLEQVDSENKKLATIETTGGDQKMTVIPMIAIMKIAINSRKPAALAIKDSLLNNFALQSEVISALNDFEVPDDLGCKMYVYAIREGELGRIKLGISRDPEKRLKQLQVGNSQALELIAYKLATNSFKDESALHAKNEQHKVSGEWFSADINNGKILEV